MLSRHNMGTYQGKQVHIQLVKERRPESSELVEPLWTDPGLQALIHFRTQSDDPISCYGKPVERTNEIAYPLISLVHYTGLTQRATDRIVGLSPKVGRGL